MIDLTDLHQHLDRLEQAVLNLALLEFGDIPGHEFHGNQWQSSAGDATSAPREIHKALDRFRKTLTDDLERNNVSTRVSTANIHGRLHAIKVSNPQPTTEPDTDRKTIDRWVNGIHDGGSFQVVINGYRADVDIRPVDSTRPFPSSTRVLKDDHAVAAAGTFNGNQHVAAPAPTVQRRERTRLERRAAGGPGVDEMLNREVRSRLTVTQVASGLIELGDLPGHDFRGNQWTGGHGSDKVDVEKTKQALERAAMVKTKVDEALAAGLATDDQFDKDKFGAPGLWSPEREALHQRIIDEILAEHSHVPTDAQAIIMGGLPGAGKTTILQNPDLGVDSNQYLTLNPDEMKERLIEAGVTPEISGLKPMELAGLIHEESSKLTYDLAEQAQSRGMNVIWDITMNDASKVESRMRDLTDDLGPRYTTKMVFVDVPIELSQQRALDRYVRASDSAIGGRYINPAIIERSADPTWGSVNRAAFETVKSQADSWQLWSSGPGGAKLIDQGGRE